MEGQKDVKVEVMMYDFIFYKDCKTNDLSDVWYYNLILFKCLWNFLWNSCLSLHNLDQHIMRHLHVQSCYYFIDWNIWLTTCHLMKVGENLQMTAFLVALCTLCVLEISPFGALLLMCAHLNYNFRLYICFSFCTCARPSHT